MNKQEKPMLTEKQGEGKVDINDDIAYFTERLNRAILKGNTVEAEKLSKQIKLLEDCSIMFHMDKQPEKRVFEINVGNNQEKGK